MLNTEESRAGAMACLSAIQIISRIESSPDPDGSTQDFWRDRDAAQAAMLLAAGKQSDFISGFIATLAEYVNDVECAGVPDPYVWKPEAAMTDEEKAAHRASYEEATA